MAKIITAIILNDMEILIVKHDYSLIWRNMFIQPLYTKMLNFKLKWQFRQ